MNIVRAAGVDIGTNSVRLLIAEAGLAAASPEVRTLHRLMTITRLGQGVDRNGYLDAEAIRRTATVLRDYRDLMRREGVEVWEVAATSAARDASNTGDFMELVADIMDKQPRVLSGREEAQLSYLGCTYDLGGLQPRDETILVVDIGGGSTEIIVGHGSDILEEISLDVGCVRMSERFLASDPPHTGKVLEMEEYLRAVLAPHVARISSFSPRLTVGLAGTVTTLSGLRQGLNKYDGDAIHHSWLSREEVEGLYEQLRGLFLAERKRFMRLEPGRADIIVGGTAVLVTLLRELDIARLLVSEKDILDGLAIIAARDAGAPG
jgi:exopolyphosphatase / guanosine-5'-triphosphate,3'-diphosphate pyrophosphatase